MNNINDLATTGAQQIAIMIHRVTRRLPQPKSPRRFRLFGWYAGRNWDMDYGLEISFAFFMRGDLMTRRDEGRLIPCAFAFRLVTGQSAEARADERLDGWIFWPRFWCEAEEIARRLAGGDE